MPRGVDEIGVGKERPRNAFLQEERVPRRVVVDEANGAVAVPGLQRLGFVHGFVMGPLNFQDEARPAT